MIYPANYEQKIGFLEIRGLLKAQCLSTLGREQVDALAPSGQAAEVNEWLAQVGEFRRIGQEADDFPLQYFFDTRPALSRIRIEGTHLEEGELFDLRRSLETICRIVSFLSRSDGDEAWLYPALHWLTTDIRTFPELVRQTDQILDKFGRIRDTASPQLAEIRHELTKTEGSISRTLNGILRMAQAEGLVEKDVAPTLRDGRLVIPVAPGLKRKIRGIVHDESASGKTVFVEPAEVVEANNRIRELENEERREVVRILTEFTNQVRPHAADIVASHRLLAQIDFVRAKAQLAEQFCAIEPTVADAPRMDWIHAVHPLLELSLRKQGRQMTALDIQLTAEKRILIISGPNAGGKSVCLKTAGLLQYMLQCGLSIPVCERSRVGIFEHIMIDIGDEQSLENDLSTYSSHLTNMKLMMRHATPRTLLLIDEFGTGTEPQIGGAIAESVLKQFCLRSAYGIITTHYQNLKHFADSHEGIANGAMLYDRHEMRPLFQLVIGQPGSSFAIEIARKTGLPEEVIRDASDIVGSDYIQSDKYLQDIVRDKRYWEAKRKAIHQREKDMERTMAKYESDMAELERSRKDILRKAKTQAEELLSDSNRRIENAIREIRESHAEKEETRRIRQELETFRQDIADIDAKANDEAIARKMEQLKARKERRAKRKQEKEAAAATAQTAPAPTVEPPIGQGSTVRIKGLTSVGTVESLEGKMATVIFGDMRTKMRTERLEVVEQQAQVEDRRAVRMTRATRETIDKRRATFHQDLDVRGMRGDEALTAVQYFIDDAILVGMARVRILHGKGNGILRQLIRQYLASVPNVAHYADEHVQFGGAGITVVDID